MALESNRFRDPALTDLPSITTVHRVAESSKHQ
jgi:hypothetical protein